MCSDKSPIRFCENERECQKKLRSLNLELKIEVDRVFPEAYFFGVLFLKYIFYVILK